MDEIKNKKRSTFVMFLIKKGIANDERQAKAILLIFAICLLLLDVGLFIKGTKSYADNVVYDLPYDVIENLPEQARSTILNQTN